MRPGGGPANVTVPQHAAFQTRAAGHSVTFRTIFTSMTCAHREPPGGSAPSRDTVTGTALRRRPSWSACRPDPGRVPGLFPVTRLPAALAVLAALPLGLLPGPYRASFAPIRSLELGVPGVAAVHRRAGAPAPRPSAQAAAAASWAASCADRSTAISASFASTRRPQPRVRRAQPSGIIRHGLIGHTHQAATPAPATQISARQTPQGSPAGTSPNSPRQWTRLWLPWPRCRSGSRFPALCC